MQIIRQLDLLKSALGGLREAGQRIALVPTMGALHAGHMQLVEQAAKHADSVVVSIFVNPTQFGPNEDLDAYPRQEAADAALLQAANVALLWAPAVDQMYPDGFASSIRVTGVSEGLCGASRPGHFDGVATVVAKLFQQVEPDVALFGEKDYQQLAVIRTMARDLDFTLDIIGVPTVRDADGLALSSRNAYLDAAQRAAAVTLPDAMRDAIAAMEAGAPIALSLEQLRERLAQAGFGPIDYVALCDAMTLAPMATLNRTARLLVAARMGKTRLIDNMAVNPAS
ncbi:MAG: pantoate--beta-alanine ligase [Blastomonas sp.]